MIVRAWPSCHHRTDLPRTGILAKAQAESPVHPEGRRRVEQRLASILADLGADPGVGR